MSLQGSLDTIGLEEVFQLFALGRKSGMLRLRRPPDAESGREPEYGCVVFDMGDVAYATTAPQEDPFGVMAHFGVAAHDTDAVAAFLRERSEEAVCRLLQWEAGEFFVDREDDLAVAVLGQPLRFATPDLLAAAAERWERWKEILAVVPSTELTLRPVTQPLGSDDPVVLDRDEWSVLAAAATVPDIEAVAVALGVSAFHVCSVVRTLVERGLVQLVAPSPAVPQPVAQPVPPVAEPVAVPPVAPAVTPAQVPEAPQSYEPVPQSSPVPPVPEPATPPPAPVTVPEPPPVSQVGPAPEPAVEVTPDAPVEVAPESQTEPAFESPVTFEVPTRTAVEHADAEAAGADADGFDKSTILRLIAGVREN